MESGAEGFFVARDSIGFRVQLKRPQVLATALALDSRLPALDSSWL